MDLLVGSTSVLNDALYYLNRLNAEEYARSLPLLSDSSIGQHSRHFIEFYQCLLAQADRHSINYCLRQRDYGIETDPEQAIAAIQTILQQLKQLDLASNLHLHTTEMETETAIPSTVGRELFYNVEHTIHHLALIKVGLKIVKPELELPSHFGIAPSTIRHRKMVHR